MRNLLTITYIFLSSVILAQDFAPPVGFLGTTAIHKDSSIFIDWAKDAKIIRGYINISDTVAAFNGDNFASFGTATSATEKADGIDCVSLGDGGQAILTFDPPIADGEGYDFAVFENGFFNPPNTEMAFLELAFVEVSSDGENFIRFPAISQTNFSTQLNAFATINCRNINNLAGKYTVNYGTPFDLNILQSENTESKINLNYITHIKLIDVVGSTNSDFANDDSEGNIINDPFPTSYNSSGFDLDAVGVINNTISENIEIDNFVIYPNPFFDKINIISEEKLIKKIEVYDILGKLIFFKEENNLSLNLNLGILQKGIYTLLIKTEDQIYCYKIIKS